MKVLITGSSHIKNPYYLTRAIEDCKLNITEVFLGGGGSVDRMGGEWARANNIDILKLRSKWKSLGREAPYKRNEEMAKICDAAVIVWDGRCRGCKHLIKELDKNYKPYFAYTAG